MYTDPQVLQVIYLAIVRYFAARREQKQVISHDGRAIATGAPRVTHGASVISDGARSPLVRQAAVRQ